MLSTQLFSSLALPTFRSPFSGEILSASNELMRMTRFREVPEDHGMVRFTHAEVFCSKSFGGKAHSAPSQWSEWATGHSPPAT